MQGEPWRTAGQSLDAARAFENAVALEQRGLARAAEHLYQMALRTNPGHAGALLNLGVLKAKEGNLNEALRLIRKSLGRDRHSAPAHGSMANVLAALGRPEDAIPYYKKALALAPHAEFHYNLGSVLQTLERYEAAAEHFSRAIAIAPGFGAAHNNLGIVLQTIGRLDEALRAFETAVDLAPRNGFYLHNLAHCKRFARNDRHLATLEALAGGIDALPGPDQIYVHFALGKALAEIGEAERSFRAISAGNALKRRVTAYDEAVTLAQIERIRDVFSPAFMRARSEQGAVSASPVFVVGMPRSGSSLVEQILAGHPAVHGAGERLDFERSMAALRGRGGAFRYPEMVPELSPEQIRAVAHRYLDSVGRAAPVGAERITDKLPANFLRLGLIHLALPNAKIIHTRRDPVDTCFSCYTLLFAGGVSYAYDLGELGRYYRAYERLMEHWHAVLPRDTILDVRYEAVVADVEGEARRLVAHCGLAWDEACLAFHATKRPVHTASALQVRQPVYRSAVGRWHAHEGALGPLLAALGAERTAASERAQEAAD